ncbi:bL21 family ribosomal protein [Candidatus Berkelbacteria bacterium]|nr:bL21 family ribosomal protein [Candidatus Berkelbacteria bacterium]
MENTNTKKIAIIKLNGSQRLVVEGANVSVNRMPNQEGETIVAEDLLHGEKVTLKVKDHSKGEKINGLKFKNKVRYLKRYGHRQLLTNLEVVSIGLKSAKVSPKAVEPKKAAEPKKTTKAKKSAKK